MNTTLAAMLLIAPLMTNIIAGEPGLGLPSRQEQADVLASVEDVLGEIRMMAEDEGELTDRSSVADLEGMVRREQDKLCLVEELALLKLSCLTSPNSVCASNTKPKIQKIIQEGHEALEVCIRRALENVTRSSDEASDKNRQASSRGQTFMETLAACSRKSGLHQLSCYRKVMLNDVVPVKTMVLDVIRSHKSRQMKVISMRNSTAECVDATTVKYQALTAQALADALACK